MLEMAEENWKKGTQPYVTHFTATSFPGLFPLKFKGESPGNEVDFTAAVMHSGKV